MIRSSQKSSNTSCSNPTAIYWTGLICCSLLFILAACSPNEAPSEATPAPGLVLEPCPTSNLSGRMQCGRHLVFEDRAAGQGRMLELNIALIPAVSRSPEPDPIFFIAGGPGQSAIENFSLLFPVFQRINQRRDIVLVDQRGTGKSNILDCPSAPDDFDMDGDLESWIKDCLNRLEADPTLYTTTIAMQDLDEIRMILGYEQINIYGVSYGTRAALTYLRMYPERVRSLILDGVVPQEQALGENVARDAQQALDLIFASCHSDLSCRQAFPTLTDTFQELLASLRELPVEVSLPNPSTGSLESLTFTSEMFASVIRLLSYAPETSALIPLLIHTAAEQDDFSKLAAQYLIIAGQLESGIAEGMNYSVICTEDAPFIDPQNARAANEGTYIGDQQTKTLERVCQSWPKGEVPAWFKEPVSSDVPALLLSGEMDPVTPPSNAEQVARGLPNSLNLVAPGQGHNVLYRGCIPTLAASFLESGSVQELNPNCVQTLGGSQFFINFTGPIP